MTDNGQAFDVVVLGGGSGGYAAALRAAELGLQVALIEKDKLGGTCLHRGCIPTKALLHAAEVADTARESEQFGVRASFESIDMAGVTKYREGVVSRLYKGLQGLVKGRGITYLEGEGRLVGPGAVEVAGQRYTGRASVLATGSYARSLPGLEIGGKVITSDQALTLDSVPGGVVVLGGGVIGVEFASVWRSFGAEVTIVEALPRLVPAEDEACSKALERAFRKRKINFKTGVMFSGVEQTDSGVTVSLDSGEPIEADLLLVAVGRGPNTAGFGYEEAGRRDGPRLRAHRRAAAHQRARRVRGRRHRARAAAGPPRLPAGHLRGRGDRGTEPGAHRRFRHPAGHLLRPRGRLGGHHRGARRSSDSAPTASSRTSTTSAATARARSWRPPASSSWSGRRSGPVVGVHMVGARIGELVGEAQLIVNWEAFPEEVAQLVHAHPTQTEALGEAHLALAGKPLHAHA